MSAPEPPGVVGDPPTDDARPPTPVVAVSYRQYTILRAMLVDGASNRLVGHRLLISEDTVKTHLRRLFPRIGARDRLHAAVLIWSGAIDVIFAADGLDGGVRHLADDLRRLQARQREEECLKASSPSTPGTASPPASPSSTWPLVAT